MEQPITHACGHEQVHYFAGYASQQKRKARWLQTTNYRACFIAGKKAVQADAVVRDSAAIAHLDLPVLAGSDRQVAWATTIRASRVASLSRCDRRQVVDRHRELPNTDLLAMVAAASATAGGLVATTPVSAARQAA